ENIQRAALHGDLVADIAEPPGLNLPAHVGGDISAHRRIAGIAQMSRQSADGAGGHAGRFGQCSDRGTTHITRMMDDVLRRLAQGLPLQVRELGPEPLQRPRLGGGEGIVAVRCGRSAACCVIHASFLISCPLRYYVAPQISSLIASLAASMASFAEASP